MLNTRGRNITSIELDIATQQRKQLITTCFAPLNFVFTTPGESTATWSSLLHNFNVLRLHGNSKRKLLNIPTIVCEGSI